jgi:hypothetical protein
MRYIRLLFLFLILTASYSCKKSNDEPLEKVLQDSIRDAQHKYRELDAFQSELNNDISTQLLSISCSLDRLISLNGSGNVDLGEAMAKVAGHTPMLISSIEKTTGGYLIYKIATNPKFKYRYTSNFQLQRQQAPGAKYGLGCNEYYTRPIPHSESAKRAEATVFKEEIARAIARLSLYPERVEVLERLSSESTSYESLLTKRRDEYLVDKRDPSIARTELNRYNEFVDKLDKSISQIRESGEILPAQYDIQFVNDLIK